MTSFAFILGVVPLAVATGAGAEMRQSLGTAVFFGMLGVTGFGLIFTPVFYVAIRGWFGRPSRAAVPAPATRRKRRRASHPELKFVFLSKLARTPLGVRPSSASARKPNGHYASDFKFT